MKQAKPEEVEQFVHAVSGKHLSTRNVDLLARGFFQGSSALRAEILSGNIDWGLQQLKALTKATADESQVNLNERERRLINSLQIIQKYLARIGHQIRDTELTPAVHAEGNLLAGGILRQFDRCLPLLQEFYDRSRQA